MAWLNDGRVQRYALGAQDRHGSARLISVSLWHPCPFIVQSRFY
jgi:hypothetical protein